MAEKQRILIVDDDENIAELISLYLMKECYETYIVNDGEEALKIFPEFKPNLILLDLMLPGIDGYQVCRELRATSQVPIIMLSAKGEIFDKVLGLELGADDYMIKPFDSKELVARVKAVLRRYQAAPAPAAPEPAQQGEYVEYPDLTVNLRGHLLRPFRGDAAEGTGASVFPGFLTEPGLHQRAALRPYLGLRIHRRHPHRRRTYQTSPGKDQGSRQLGADHRVGHWI